VPPDWKKYRHLDFLFSTKQILVWYMIVKLPFFNPSRWKFLYVVLLIGGFIAEHFGRLSDHFWSRWSAINFDSSQLRHDWKAWRFLSLSDSFMQSVFVLR
jgi:hypothetical protein